MTTTGKRGVKLMNERQPVIKLSKLQKHEKWSLIIFLYFCDFFYYRWSALYFNGGFYYLDLYCTLIEGLTIWICTVFRPLKCGLNQIRTLTADYWNF